MNNQQEFICALTSFAGHFNKKLNEYVISVYVDTAERIGFDAATVALKKYFYEGKFPTASEIEKFKNGEGSKQSEAATIAGSIIGCVSRFGMYQSSEARQVIGPVGWCVVENYGGWDIICDYKKGERANLFAHLRQMAESAISRSESETFTKMLSENNGEQILLEEKHGGRVND